jgi:hypothetical protein
MENQSMSNKHQNSSVHSVSDDELDILLGEVDFLEVPQQFTNKVMQRIYELPQSAVAPSTLDAITTDTSRDSSNASQPKSEWWQWVALIGGGIPALLQILAFIFSAWNVASLG